MENGGIDFEKITQIIKRITPTFLSSYCVVNGNILNTSQVEQMGVRQYAYNAKLCTPEKLYKYFPNSDNNGTNYSMLALENNTVFLQSPSNFDDIFDSRIEVEYEDFKKYFAKHYCTIAGIPLTDSENTEEILIDKIIGYISEKGNLTGFFPEKERCKNEKLKIKCFELEFRVGLMNGKNVPEIIAYLMQKEYREFKNEINNSFKVSCFATTPYSQLMWAKYADEFKGFCVEYTISSTDPKMENIYYGLLPVIYCKTRSNVTKILTEKSIFKYNTDYLWALLSGGPLRKSLDWVFQNEWRLILPKAEVDEIGDNINFFPISKVFLGAKMGEKQKEEIIKVCAAKNIPFVNVKESPSKFEMEECITDQQ